MNCLSGFPEGFWIVGTRLGNEPSFYWFGNEQPVTFTDWLENNPDNWKWNENCIEIWPFKGSKWNDRECLMLNNFICEKVKVHVDGFDLNVRSNTV